MPYKTSSKPEDVFFYKLILEEKLKKNTKAVLHLILAGIVSVIAYIGFKKGAEAVEKELEEKDNKES